MTPSPTSVHLASLRNEVGIILRRSRVIATGPGLTTAIAMSVRTPSNTTADPSKGLAGLLAGFVLCCSPSELRVAVESRALPTGINRIGALVTADGGLVGSTGLELVSTGPQTQLHVQLQSNGETPTSLILVGYSEDSLPENAEREEGLLRFAGSNDPRLRPAAWWVDSPIQDEYAFAGPSDQPARPLTADWVVPEPGPCDNLTIREVSCPEGDGFISGLRLDESSSLLFRWSGHPVLFDGEDAREVQVDPSVDIRAGAMRPDGGLWVGERNGGLFSAELDRSIPALKMTHIPTSKVTPSSWSPHRKCWSSGRVAVPCCVFGSIPWPVQSSFTTSTNARGPCPTFSIWAGSSRLEATKLSPSRPPRRKR